MVYTALSAAIAGTLINAAWMNLYLRDNLNALNTGGGKVPPQAIIWWPADVLTRPANWQACDGTLGVVDLRDRFIVGAGTTYAVHDVGGSATQGPLSAHTAHSLSTPSHISQHLILAAGTHPPGTVGGVGSATAISVTPPLRAYANNGAHSSTLTSGAHTHANAALTNTHGHGASSISVIPPYRALTPILKGAPTVAFPTPKTWADGDVPNAAMFNADLRDAFNSLRQQMLYQSSIVLWSGSLASLPGGYQLCDGSNGTPDMRDRFAVQAGTSYVVGAAGGAASASIASHSNHAATQADAHGLHGQSIGTHPSTTAGFRNDLQESFYEFLDHSNVTVNGNHGTHSGFAVDAHTAHADVATIPPYIALGYIALQSAGSFTTPRTWADGELIDASRINTYMRDNEAALYNGQVPIGAILVWHDSIASIPANYSLCNGSGGRPETRDRLIVGAGLSYAVSATGGAASVTPTAHPAHSITQPTAHAAHTLTSPAHPMTLVAEFSGPGGNTLYYSSSSHNFSLNPDSYHDHTFAIDAGAAHSAHDAVDLRPPYHALAFMQRVS
jgi:hypothetical protein